MSNMEQKTLIELKSIKKIGESSLKNAITGNTCEVQAEEKPSLDKQFVEVIEERRRLCEDQTYQSEVVLQRFKGEYDDFESSNEAINDTDIPPMLIWKDIEEDGQSDGLTADWEITNIQMINHDQEKVPTDTYGQILYGKRCVHYVRVAFDTKASDVYKLINRFWNMTPPILAVSLIGEGDLKSSINKAASEKIFESMEKVVSTPRTCLISDGKYKLNPRLLECTSVDSSFMHLGITHFGSLDIKDYLIASEPGSSILDAPESESLDPCHTHVLLIDDGKNTNGVEIDFRAKFESFLFVATNDLTQIVSFAMGGEDEYTMEMLEKTLENKIPLFVVKQDNSKQGADFLATQLEEKIEKEKYLKSKHLKKDSLKQYALLKKKGTIRTTLKESHRMSHWHKPKVVAALEAAYDINQVRLIDGTEDVDKLFLEAIMKNAYTDHDKRATVLLYVLWNQGEEFWNKNVFANCYTEGDFDTSVVIFMALALNRFDFLKSFRDSLMYKAIEQFTSEDLRFLYWYRVFGCPRNERTGVLKHFIRTLRSPKQAKDKNGKEFSECDVESELDFAGGKIKVNFIDYFCKITGISKNFPEPTMETIELTIVNLQKSVFTSGSAPIKCEKLFENTSSGLLLWAVLNGMEDMALLLLDFVNQQCAMALFVSAISEIISLHEKLPESLQQVYADMKIKFENVAVSIVERGYQVDTKRTIDLLLREIDFMAPYTCIDLSVEARQLKFISHSSVQTLFNHFWRGPWLHEFTVVDFILTSMCPFYLTAFEYRNDKKLQDLSEILGRNIYFRKDWGICGPKWVTEEEPEISVHHRSFRDEKTGKTTHFHDAKYVSQQPRALGCCGELAEFTFKCYLYLKTPKVKFYWHFISSIVFLALISYSVLEETKTTKIRIIDWILLAFIISHTTREIKQIVDSRSPQWKTKFKLYFQSLANKIDIIAICIFYIGFAMKTSPSLKEYGDLLLAGDAYIWIVRSLRTLYFFRVLGPYTLMIQMMVKDMMKFLVILFVFTVAHGVCFTAIMKPQNRSWNMLRDIIYHPYYNIYGELFFQHATDTTTIFGTEKRNEYASTLGLISLGIYVLIANVLLLNLLIAIFGNTYAEVNTNAHQVWAYQRYLLTVEYSQRTTLPPPFSIFAHLFLFFRWCCSLPCNSKTAIMLMHNYSFKRQLNSERHVEINKFESKMMKHQNEHQNEASISA